MSQPGEDTDHSQVRRLRNAIKEKMNCKSCRKRKVLAMMRVSTADTADMEKDQMQSR
jgi:hypothetical protein